MTGRTAAFAPVADARTRVLVLGSLPGVESLRQRQYYADPRNAFWRLIGPVAGQDLAALPYPERLTALQGARIGLWDVIATAARRGSLDAAICDAEHADLRGLIARMPELRAIAFNGRKPATTGRRVLGALPGGPDLVDLPSSSSAYARMPFDAKLARWSVLAAYLR